MASLFEIEDLRSKISDFWAYLPDPPDLPDPPESLTRPTRPTAVDDDDAIVGGEIQGTRGIEDFRLKILD